ncbi:MAG: PAS domain S-box protein [Phycisphaeraceae bacterium]|nr:PAS domain S-box protein [Phycisphaeraceae bacterium]
MQHHPEANPLHELEYNAADEQMMLPTWVTRPTVMVQLLVSTSFVLAWLSVEVISQNFLTFQSESGGSVSGWYPTAGLGVALLWALGLRYAWVIVPTALLGQMGVWGYEFAPSLLLAMIKAMTYSSAAVVLRRALPPGALPARPMQIGNMIATMLGCAAFTAAACVSLLVTAGLIKTEEMLDATIGWTVGDAIGILVTAPLMVLIVAPTICDALCKHRDEAKQRYTEAMGNRTLASQWTPWLLIIGTAVGMALLASVPEEYDPRVYYLGFVLLPALAMRYKLAGALIGLLLVSFAGMFTAILQGIGMPALTDLQLIMIALGISTILVGSFAVMRSLTELKRQAEHRWATMAIRGSGMGRWHWEVGSDEFNTDFILTDAFGYRRDKVIPLVGWWTQRIHAEDVRLNQTEMAKLLQGKSDYFEVENRMLAADGTWGWFYSQGTVIERDAQGKPKRIAGTHHDITERKELERIRADAEATHRSEQRFRTLADGAPVAIFQTDAKGVFLYVNPTWCMITGLAQTDALYRSAAAFAHTDDRDAVTDHWATAVQTGTPVSIEHRVVRDDGSVLWLQTQATPMKHNGVMLGFVGTGVDVTPYRQAMAMIADSEARYRTLADHAYDMLWRVDAEANFTYVSPSITKLMGYTPEEMVNTNAFDYFHEEDIERVRGKHAALSPDEPEFHDVHRYRCKDGSYIVFEAVGRLVVPDPNETKDESNDGQPYITGISRDVTQRVEGEQIRRELEEKLARSQKLDAIGTFATGIAHDFRNSLMAINLSAQSAARKLEPDHAAQPALNTVEEAVAQAMQVTQSLLTFARGQGAAKRPTDLTQLIKDNARLLETVLPPSISLQIECPDTPLRIKANASEIQQTLLNLVMNAKDAIPGEGTITLTLKQGSDTALLTIKDTGVGMPQEVLRRALEPFYTTKARLKGTGLGLSQAHGIVSDHGGEITLDSKPNLGTTITITLPLIDSNPRSQTTEPKTEATTT